MLSWDDLKYFLVMAEEGSLSAASKKLVVSQPTLSRHLTALEENVGAELFSRTRSGLELTSLGERMLSHAKDMQDEVHAVERLITGHDTSLEGTVVISTIESIGAEWLVKHTRPFHDTYPGITVDFKLTHTSSDLLRREADIALRLFRPVQNDLVAKKTVTMNYGYYASRDYIERNGKPERLSDLKDFHQVLPHDDILAMLPRASQRPWKTRANVTFRSNSFLALSTAVREGYGVGAYPCLMAAHDDNLVRLMDDLIIFSTDIWLVSHAELRRSARIRAMYDYLGDLLHTHARDFSGAY
ncbi:MAG: LysR family transcriptional regulator [Kordiimonas sp.]